MSKSRLRGWIQNYRRYANKYFLDFRSLGMAGDCQIVAKKSELDPCRQMYLDADVKKVLDSRSSAGFEYHIIRINKILKPTVLPPFEIGAKNRGTKTETRAKNRTFDLRTRQNHAIFTLMSELQFAIIKHFRNSGYLQINTPKILGSGSQGGTEVFRLKYYDKLAFLAQSPQLHKQMVVSAGYEKIFELGYMYRAEKSSTNKHLSEIFALDIEGAYDSTMDIIMQSQKMLIEISKYMATSQLVNAAEKILGKKIIPLSPADFQIVTYSKCMSILGYDRPVDFSIEDERKLGKELGKISKYYFVVDYPPILKPFYIGKKDGKSLGFDLYDTSRELSSGGMRQTNILKLKKNMVDVGINPKNFLHYMQAFKYAPPPHGGCCFGLPRLLMSFYGFKNIREVVMYPRDMKKLGP